MANNITIDIDAKDNASGIIGGVFELVRQGANAFDVVALAASTAAKFVGDSTKAAFEYDQQILGLSLSTNQSTEATSRMVQVLDDAGIGFDTVKKAMREMSKDGTEPNIQELARLSDEFLSLNTGAERGKFLLDKFGKSGEDMARVMALGRDNILEMNDAIEGNLIVTQKAAEEAEQYRKNVDELNDSWSAFKIGLGNDIIPLINDAVDSQTRWSEAVDQARQELDTMNPQLVNQYAAMIMQRQATIAASDAVASHGDALDGAVISTQNMAAATELSTEEIKAMTAANNASLSLIQRLQADTKDYNKNLAEMTEMYGEGSEQVRQLEADHKQAMQAIAYDLYIAKLQAGDFTDAEFAMAIAAGVAMGQIDQATANMVMDLDEAATAAMGLGTDLYRAKDAADALSGDYAVNIITNYVYRGVPPDFNGPLCFISGTPVLSVNEHKLIETLKVGDFVRSYDTEAKEFVDVSIAQIFSREVDSYLLINGVGVTVEHPFFANGEWVKAGELQIGDVLLSENETPVIVTSIEYINKNATVYNIHTATEPHNYFAGGVLVHNKVDGASAGGPPSSFGASSSPYAVRNSNESMSRQEFIYAIQEAIRPLIR